MADLDQIAERIARQIDSVATLPPIEWDEIKAILTKHLRDVIAATIEAAAVSAEVEQDSPRFDGNDCCYRTVKIIVADIRRLNHTLVTPAPASPASAPPRTAPVPPC